MNYVVNPMLFYWSSVSDALKAFSIAATVAIGIVCLVCLGIGFFGIIEGLDYGGGQDSDEYKAGVKLLNWARKCIVPLVVLLIFSVFIPSEKNDIQNDGCECRHIREY